MLFQSFLKENLIFTLEIGLTNNKKHTFISAISIAEIKKGIYKIKPSQPERALKLQN